MRWHGLGYLFIIALAVILGSTSSADQRPEPADATACSMRFAVVLFRVQGADGVTPEGISASTRELESGEPVRDTAAIPGHGTVFLADDSLRDRFVDGDLDLVTTLRVGEREREVIHRVGLDPTGCHVVLKDGPRELVLED